MKPQMTVAALILLSMMQPVMAQESNPENEVRAAVAAFGRAFEGADIASLEAHLAENYLHVNGRSGNVSNRSQWLGWMKSREQELKRGELEILVYRIDDVEVQVHGRAAVVTGIVQSSGRNKGVPFDLRVRFTNVWVKQEGVWQRAAFHDSPLPDPAR